MEWLILDHPSFYVCANSCQKLFAGKQKQVFILPNHCLSCTIFVSQTHIQYNPNDCHVFANPNPFFFLHGSLLYSFLAILLDYAIRRHQSYNSLHAAICDYSQGKPTCCNDGGSRIPFNDSSTFIIVAYVKNSIW